MTKRATPARIQMWVARDRDGYYITLKRLTTWTDYKGEVFFRAKWDCEIRKSVANALAGKALDIMQAVAVELEKVK